MELVGDMSQEPLTHLNHLFSGAGCAEERIPTTPGQHGQRHIGCAMKWCVNNTNRLSGFDSRTRHQGPPGPR